MKIALLNEITSNLWQKQLLCDCRVLYGRLHCGIVVGGVTQRGRLFCFAYLQDAEVAERTLMLQKVFNRYTAGKLVVTDTQPDVSGSASFSMLVRSLISPISSNRAVFEHIVSFYISAARANGQHLLATNAKFFEFLLRQAGDQRFTEPLKPDALLVGFPDFVGMPR